MKEMELGDTGRFCNRGYCDCGNPNCNNHTVKVGFSRYPIRRIVQVIGKMSNKIYFNEAMDTYYYNPMSTVESSISGLAITIIMDNNREYMLFLGEAEEFLAAYDRLTNGGAGSSNDPDNVNTTGDKLYE